MHCLSAKNFANLHLFSETWVKISAKSTITQHKSAHFAKSIRRSTKDCTKIKAFPPALFLPSAPLRLAFCYLLLSNTANRTPKIAKCQHPRRIIGITTLILHKNNRNTHCPLAKYQNQALTTRFSNR